MLLGLALLLRLWGGLLGDRSVQPVLILLLKLRRRRDLVDGLEELEGRIHLVLDISELVVDGQDCLALWAFIACLYQFCFFVPGRFLIDLASVLEVQPLGIERGAKPNLKKVVVFPVSPQLETDISLDCSRTDRVAGGPPARRNLGENA